MNTGQIVKSKTTRRFTVLPNELVRSKVLTCAEKGLLAYLLSLPDNWAVYKTKLPEDVGEKRGTINRIFAGLVEKGFIISVKAVDSGGRFVGWNHIVYDEATFAKPEIGINRDRNSPTSTKPDVGQSRPIRILEEDTNTVKDTNTKTKTKKERKLNKKDNIFPFSQNSRNPGLSPDFENVKGEDAEPGGEWGKGAKTKKQDRTKNPPVPRTPPANPFHAAMKAEWMSAYDESCGELYVWSAKDAKALNLIRDKIRVLNGSDDKTVVTWKALLAKMPAWYRKNAFDLATINSKFSQIINSIKNEAGYYDEAEFERQVAESSAFWESKRAEKRSRRTEF